MKETAGLGYGSIQCHAGDYQPTARVVALAVRDIADFGAGRINHVLIVIRDNG